MMRVPPESVHIRTPSLGDVVTFSFSKSTRSESPMNPVIFRTRSDTRWEEIVFNSLRENTKLHGIHFVIYGLYYLF